MPLEDFHSGNFPIDFQLTGVDQKWLITLFFIKYFYMFF